MTDEFFDLFKQRFYAETHGSGLNSSYDFKQTRKGLHLHTFYHPMNEAGYYMKPVPVNVWFSFKEPLTVTIRCTNTDGLREYLDDLFWYACENILKTLKAENSL